jgi:uroporphyrinogen III methyltransferase/synthase
MNRDFPTKTEAALPFCGKRIVITRARAQAASLARAIEELGGDVIEFPTIEIQPAADPEQLDQAAKNLKRYDWLIFTSANAVEIFLHRMARLKIDARELAAKQIAAIGPETAKRLAAAGIKQCLVPASYRAEGILDMLRPQAMHGKRVLIPRAAKAREVLPESLRQWGAEVDVVETYRTVVAKVDPRKLKERLRRREIDMVTFTSSSTVANFAKLFDGERLAGILGKTPVACIGPITEHTVEELGGVVAVSAQEFTIPGLVSAMVEYFRGGAPGPVTSYGGQSGR